MKRTWHPSKVEKENTVLDLECPLKKDKGSKIEEKKAEKNFQFNE